ncbi:MAG: hypothetical protein NC324_05465, partial [Bacteroides sp.]|nr:hypothetical protein [Bacteroides sp.]
MGVRSATRVRLPLIGALLVLGFTCFAQMQKRCLSVKGNGYVRVVTSLSKEVNSSTDFCVNFDVKDGGENIDFVIKPGAQYYLEKIEVEDTSGKINVIPPERIYAERDDSLHFQCQDNINLRYFFVFKEAQPWPIEDFDGKKNPYKSRDTRYCQIYCPAELCRNSYQSQKYDIISLQNNIESATSDKIVFISALQQCNILRGNNKTFKNSISWQFPNDGDCTVTDLHILSGLPFYFNQPRVFYSFVRCTVNPTKNLNDGFPIFCLTANSEGAITSHDCINFGDCDNEKPSATSFYVAQNAKNLINWGSVKNATSHSVQKLSAFIGADTSKRISYVFNFGRMPNLILVPDGTTQPIFSPYFNDKNLAPETEMPTHGAFG